MSEPQRGRILFVDDEPLVLSGLRRAMAGAFTIETASSGAEGLAILGAAAGDEPFAVVVSDMMMPAMTGAEFLVRARDVAPDAVLMILSGQADLTSTVEAVNNAKLFRFLTKPCSAEDIGRSLDDALRQHQLVTAERELLERTLLGAIDTLMKVLAIANPTVFGRASRVADLVGATATRLGCVSWELRVAALLSQIGGVALPDELVESVRYGAPLSEEEAAVYATHRQVAADLVSSIPRLERVAEWIGSQPIAPAPGRTGHVYTSGAADVADLPIERVILHATIAYLAGRQSGLTPPEVVTRLSAVYPSRVVLAINA
jgi:response regulator RpfG family c-di-GMP phosphodiesterase